MKILVAALVCASANAWAFHTPGTFDDTAAKGGGHRIYFTGSARQKGYDCGMCHTDSAGKISAQVQLTPSASGAYVPGQLYSVAVKLVGEHRGFGARNNQNGFVAEVVDDTGQTAGTYASTQNSVELIDDGRVIAGEKADTTMWTFSWQAPVAGRGPVTLHLGMLDGDGASISSAPQTDPGGDDVAMVKLRMCEGAAGCADRPAMAVTASPASGCNAGGDASPFVALVLVCLLVLRRRSIVLALALAGCYDANVPGECPDHVCGTTGADAPNGCTENWVCTSWEAPIGSSQAARVCTDKNNLGTTSCKPAETATLPALDIDMYKCRVQPIFQRGCGMMACHGNETEHPFRIYSRGRWRNKQKIGRAHV
jgi:uncharacterized protein (TIGR03382 family)